MTKIKETFYDENGKELDLSGTALRKQDALEVKKPKKSSKNKTSKRGE